VITYSWKAFHCELCKAKYKEQIKNPFNSLKEVLLFDISKPSNNYIVLESYVSEASGAQNI
jgi:hypothetical protein